MFFCNKRKDLLESAQHDIEATRKRVAIAQLDTQLQLRDAYKHHGIDKICFLCSFASAYAECIASHSRGELTMGIAINFEYMLQYQDRQYLIVRREG